MGITAAAGTHTCPLLVARRTRWSRPISKPGTSRGPRLLLHSRAPRPRARYLCLAKSLLDVTISLCQHWTICAPAAILRSSSLRSCSFSRIKHMFSVSVSVIVVRRTTVIQIDLCLALLPFLRMTLRNPWSTGARAPKPVPAQTRSFKALVCSLAC